jgi:hypothetical protein
MDDKAEEHFSDLHVAAAIVAICESSIFRTESGRTFARKIIKAGNAEQQRQLRAYDWAKEDTSNG